LLCNGTNGTPDLRNSFILGAGNSYSVGQTGGSTDAIVVSHTHTASVTDPGHFHTEQYSGGTPGAGNGISDANNGAITASAVNTASAVTGISVTNATAGTSGAGANMPPFYALAFIMKS